jgi:hypothetical protein
VFVIDSKQYRGRLQLDAVGKLWHGRYPLAPALRAVSWEADQAARVLPDPGVAVVPIVAVQGAQVPWGKVVSEGVPVLEARRLPSMLRALPAVLGLSGSPPWPTRPKSASALPPDLQYLKLVPRPATFAPMAPPLTDPSTVEALTSRILGE